MRGETGHQVKKLQSRERRSETSLVARNAVRVRRKDVVWRRPNVACDCCGGTDERASDEQRRAGLLASETVKQLLREDSSYAAERAGAGLEVHHRRERRFSGNEKIHHDSRGESQSSLNRFENIDRSFDLL